MPARKPWTLKVEGIEQIQTNLSRVMNRMTGTQAKEVFLKAGLLLRDKARSNTPYDPKRTEGTHLRDAIFCARGDPNKPSVLVGVRYKEPGARHAHLVEFGHHYLGRYYPPHPYFRPAVAQMSAQIKDTISDGLLKVIEGAK